MSQRRLFEVPREEMTLLAAEHTDEEIGEMFGATKQAAWSRRRGYEPPVERVTRSAGDYRRYIPWVVDVHHQGHYLARMLRLHARYNTGGELAEKQQRMLAAFWTQCDHLVVTWAEYEGPVVVAYDRNHTEGFSVVAARATDENYIRQPEAAVT